MSIKATHGCMTIEQFVQLSATTHPYLQRSDEVWGKQQVGGFLTSFVNCRAHSDIILVDVKACKRYCETLMLVTDDPHTKNQAKRSLELFGKIEHDYLILDGGNRTKRIRGFYRGTEKLPANTKIVNARGITVGKTLSKPMSYDELLTVHSSKERIAGVLEDSPLVSVKKINSAMWVDLEEDFVGINSNEPLVDMERLWVCTSGHSLPLRPIVLDHEDNFQQRYSQNGYVNPNRKGLAKILAQAAMIFEKKSADIKQKNIEGFWKKDAEISSKTLEHVKNFASNLANIDLDKNNSLLKRDSKRKTPKKWVSSTASYAVGELTKDGVVISPESSFQFAAAIIEATEHVYDASHSKYCKDMAKLKLGEEPKAKSQYLYHMMSNHEVGSPRVKFMRKVMQKVKANLVEAGLIEQEQRLTLQE